MAFAPPTSDVSGYGIPGYGQDPTARPFPDPLGGPFSPNAVQNAKRDQKRKDAARVMRAVAPPPGTVAPPATAPRPAGQQPQNATSDAAPQLAQPKTPVPTETVPQFQAAQYQPPKKGLEYLALGLGILFPGAPIAKMAAGFAGGLQQGAEASYQRRERTAEQQYGAQQAQAQASFENQKATRAAELETNQIKFANDQANYQRAQQLRQQGIDPTTGRPFVLPPQLQRVLPPGLNRAPSATDYLRHEQALAGFYAGVGATDQAALHKSLAADYQKQAIDDANNARILNMTLLRERESERHQERQFQHSEDQQNRMFTHSENMAQARFGDELYLQALREAHQDARSTLVNPEKKAALRDEAMRAESTFRADWAKAIRSPLDQNGAPKTIKDATGADMRDPSGNPMYVPARVSAPEAAALAKMFTAIDRNPDPAGLAQRYVDSSPGLKPEAQQLLIQRGLYRDLLRRSQGGVVPPQPPGSDKATNPTTKVNPANGKTYYLHPDGKYYNAPPSGGGPQAAAPFASPTP
jgi:hypothetical protein